MQWNMQDFRERSESFISCNETESNHSKCHFVSNGSIPCSFLRTVTSTETSSTTANFIGVFKWLIVISINQINKIGNF